MKDLINAINYLQRNDSNGTYKEMLEEIDAGDLSVSDAKTYCREVLSTWQIENIGPDDDDIKTSNRLQELIDSLELSYIDIREE